jgi:3-methyladenine DNA glycosylase AlkD
MPCGKDGLNLIKTTEDMLRQLNRMDATSVRSIQRECSRALKGKPAADVLKFARRLIHGGDWQERLIAWESLAAHRAAFGLVNDELVEAMAENLSDWGSIDLYGVTIVGTAWNRGQVTDAKIVSWAKSPDRWRRRLALVATVPLNAKSRGGVGDTRRTLRICRLLLDDRDDMVVKAMSWALRELAKRNPKDVDAFLAAEKNRIAPRVRREVTNKLKTGLKSPRRQRKT